MNSLRNSPPPPRDPRSDRGVIPLVPTEWSTADESWPGGHPRDLDTADITSVHDVSIAPERPDFSDEPQTPEPSVHAPRRPSAKKVQLASRRPSAGRRLFRSIGRFFIIALIGVGGTLAWQSHGDEATAMIRTWAPSLAWLLPEPTMPSGGLSAADRTASAGTQRADVPRSGAEASISPVWEQRIEVMARELALVRQSIEQLAANQDQMAQNITSLQTIEQDIREKLSAPRPSQAPPAAAQRNTPRAAPSPAPAAQPAPTPSSARAPLPLR
jgi:hypothetical protein